MWVSVNVHPGAYRDPPGEMVLLRLRHRVTMLDISDPLPDPTSTPFPVPNITCVLTCQNTHKQKNKKNSKAEHGRTREETLSQGAVRTRSTETRPDPGEGEEPKITAIRRCHGPPTSPRESGPRASATAARTNSRPPVQRAPTEETLKLKEKKIKIKNR